MKRKINLKMTPVALAVSCALATPVFAQEGGSSRLEEIVVTATRRAQSVSDIPYNISAVTADDLDRGGVVDFTKLTRMIPGLGYIDQGPRDAGFNSTIIIRGMNATGAGGSDVVSLAAPTVSTYVDETPLFINLHLYDIERVEVLRGPQGTLYGSGSLGGTIRYIHNKPDTDSFYGRLDAKTSVTANSDGVNYDIGGVLNIPVTDNFALRFAGGYKENDGFIDMRRVISLDEDWTPTFVDPNNPFASPLQEEVVKDTNFEKITHFRASALLDIGDSATVNLSWQHQKEEFGGAQISNPGHPDGGPYTNTNSILEILDRTVDVVALDLDIDLGFARLASSTSYFRNEQIGNSDQNGTYLNAAFWYLYLGGGNLYYDGFGAENVLGRYSVDNSGFTQEIRLASQGDGPLEWLIGAFYLDQSVDADQPDIATGYWDLLGYPGSYGLDLDESVAVLGYKDTIYRQQIFTDYTDKAIFGEVTYHFTDRFQVTGGARVFTQQFDNQTDIFLNICSSFCANDGLDPYGRTGGTTSADFSDQIFKLNASYDLTDSTMVYGTWSEGFRHGGANGLPTTENAPGGPFSEDPALDPYDPDKATNWEAGIKGRAFDDRMQFTAAVFYIDWQDIQLDAQSPLGAFPIIVNGNDAESKGIELDATVALSDRFVTRLGYAYADSVLTESFVLGGGITGIEGDRLPGTPKHMASWSGDYFLPLGQGELVFHLNGSYLSDTTNTIIAAIDAPGTQSVALWDANISFETQNWAFGLFVDNLFDKLYESAQRGNVIYNTFGNPAFDDTSAYAGTVYDGLSVNDVRNLFAGQQDSPGKQLQRSVNRPRTVGLSIRYKF